MIESAELNVYFKNGEMTTIDLSPMQLKTIVVALGLSFPDENSVACFSDKSLTDIVDHLQNHIKLKP